MFLKIYRTPDAPLYRTGNKVLLGLIAYNIVLILSSKMYYVRRNAWREKAWRGMSEREKAEYLSTTTDKGNKRYVERTRAGALHRRSMLIARQTRFPVRTLKFSTRERG